MRRGELLDLRDDAYLFINEAGNQQRTTVEDLYLEETSDDWAADFLADVQHDLRQGFDRLHSVGNWHPFGGLEDPAPHWVLWRLDDGTLVRRYAGVTKLIFMAAAADLLVDWWPKLRRCKHEVCRTWFLPRHGRQIYHDARCSQQARWKNFAPKRTRDYHAEYARRVERDSPGAKPKRRSSASRPCSTAFSACCCRRRSSVVWMRRAP